MFNCYHFVTFPLFSVNTGRVEHKHDDGFEMQNFQFETNVEFSSQILYFSVDAGRVKAKHLDCNILIWVCIFNKHQLGPSRAFCQNNFKTKSVPKIRNASIDASGIQNLAHVKTFLELRSILFTRSKARDNDVQTT